MRRHLWIPTLCFALSACDSSGAPKVTTSVNAIDSATVSPLLTAANTTLPAFTQFVAAAGLDIGIAPPMWVNAAVCLPQASLFVCPGFAPSNGMQATSNYELLDAQSHAQSGFNTATTSAIKVKWIASSLSPPGFSLISVELTTDVHASPAVYSGVNFANVGTSGFTPAVPITNMNTIVTGLKMGPDHYPIAGTLDGTLAVINPPAATTFANLKLTYDGSATGTVVKTVANVQTRTCIIDLRTPFAAATCTPP